MNSPVICQSVRSQMADFSAGQLSPVEANAFEQHCAQCAICRHEWETFQNTLLLLSGMCQPVPCEELSDEMWKVCAADWMMHVEMRRSKVPMLGAVRGWTMQHPRWGWAAVGGAFMVAGTVWMLSPANTSSDATNLAGVAAGIPSEIPSDGGPIRVFGQPFEPPQNSAAQSGAGFSPYSFDTRNAQRVGLDVPSSMPTTVMRHQNQMPDLFVDRVGADLATSDTQTFVNQPVVPPFASPAPRVSPAAVPQGASQSVVSPVTGTTPQMFTAPPAPLQAPLQQMPLQQVTPLETPVNSTPTLVPSAPVSSARVSSAPVLSAPVSNAAPISTPLGNSSMPSSPAPVATPRCKHPSTRIKAR